MNIFHTEEEKEEEEDRNPTCTQIIRFNIAVIRVSCTSADARGRNEVFSRMLSIGDPAKREATLSTSSERA